MLVGLPKVSVVTSTFKTALVSLSNWAHFTQSPLHVENPLADIVFKSLTLKTIHGRKIFHTWEETERLVFENQ